MSPAWTPLAMMSLYGPMRTVFLSVATLFFLLVAVVDQLPPLLHSLAAWVASAMTRATLDSCYTRHD